MSEVFKCIEFPNREFETQKEMFLALKANKQAIVKAKKEHKNKSQALNCPAIKIDSSTNKAMDFEDGYIYPVINTTKYMDSHNDVHLNGIWDKSLKEQQGKIYFLADHNMSISSVIAFPKDVEAFTLEIPWTSLGKEFSGTTQALMFKVSRKDLRLQAAKDIINEKIDIEHSVSMIYVQVDLAVDSRDEDFKEENKLYHKYINQIANKECVMRKGYYWAVKEARIYKEGSMVLAGSNDATPMIYGEKSIEPLDNGTQNNKNNEGERESGGEPLDKNNTLSIIQSLNVKL